MTPFQPLQVASELMPANASPRVHEAPNPINLRGTRHGVYLLGNDDPLWDRLALDDSFSIYRKKAWKNIIEQTYGHNAEYIAAVEDGILVDLLPFFLVKDYLNRKKLISTPYQGSNGGFLSQNPEVRKSLIDYIVNYAHALKVQYVEMRSSSPIPELEAAGFIAKCPLFISFLALRSLEENWAMLTPKHRRNVRLAAKNGVTIQVAHEYAEMKAFYNMLAEHYKGLGVPFYGEQFFRQFWEKLVQKENATLLLAKYEGQLIGGHLLLFNGATLISKFSVTFHHERYAKLYAAYALYWDAIRLGVQLGFKDFDLGITGESNTGLREFKARLGAEEKALYFYYYRLKGDLPDYDKYYNSYKFLRFLWKIAPNYVTNLVGDYINTWIC